MAKRILHLLLYPASDIPGQWIAECAELGLVTQGNSEAHALLMIGEMLSLTVADYLRDGEDPFEQNFESEH